MAAPMRNPRSTADIAMALLRRVRLLSSFTGEHKVRSGLCKITNNKSVTNGYISRCSMCYEARKVDIAASKQSFMFDTHALVKKLEVQEFTQGQSEALTEALVQIITADVEYQQKNMVTKAQQEIMMQQVMSHIASVRKDMVILEKSEFSQLKHEYEAFTDHYIQSKKQENMITEKKQSIEIKQLKQTLQDEVQKLKSGMTLDMSLERARAQEDHATNERYLAKIDSKLEIHETEVQKMLSQVDNKIDKEVANMTAIFERYKADSMKYAAGTILTCLTVCLGFYRIWKS